MVAQNRKIRAKVMPVIAKVICYSEEAAKELSKLCGRFIVLGSSVITDEKFTGNADQAIQYVSTITDEISQYDLAHWKASLGGEI